MRPVHKIMIPFVKPAHRNKRTRSSHPARPVIGRRSNYVESKILMLLHQGLKIMIVWREI